MQSYQETITGAKVKWMIVFLSRANSSAKHPACIVVKIRELVA